MGKLIVNSYEEFAAHKGEQIGVSEWVTLSQDMIDKFAEATLDHQWIHTDPERCKTESPYHQTIAHGYLQLSLLPYLWQQIIQVNNVKMLVNYGMDKMKFGQPVLSGSRVRLVASLRDIEDLRGICKAQIDFKLMIENDKKFALKGIATFLYYFDK
jgi:acyl dehydratase